MGQFTTSALSGGSEGPATLTVIGKPAVTGASPHVAPYQSSDARVVVSGKNFDSGGTFLCNYEGRFFRGQSEATVVSTSSLECPIPEDVSCRQLPCFVRLRLLVQLGEQ